MTTIVAVETETHVALAADSQRTSSRDAIAGEVRKTACNDRFAIGFGGSFVIADRLCEVFSAVSDGDIENADSDRGLLDLLEVVMKDQVAELDYTPGLDQNSQQGFRDYGVSGLIALPGGIYGFPSNLGFIPIPFRNEGHRERGIRFDATGTGMDYAIGTLMGEVEDIESEFRAFESAVRAVHIASELDPYSGGPIVVHYRHKNEGGWETRRFTRFKP